MCVFERDLRGQVIFELAVSHSRGSLNIAHHGPMSLRGHDYSMFCFMHVIKLTLIQLIFIKLYIVISNNIVNLS